MSLITQEKNTTQKPNLIAIRKIKKEYEVTLQDAVTIAQKHGIQIYKLASGDKAFAVHDLPMFKLLAEEYKTQQQRTTKQDTVVINIPEPRVRVRDRDNAPYRTILFSGPTNSGKTYHGLNQLFEDYEANPDKVHVYCGPLRLLAYEVYNKMKDRYGEDNVGFITGEEAINPDAKLLATTCEMAPEEGGSILLDEAHWLADPDRGDTWAKILLSHTYENFYILTAAEALPIIEHLMADSWEIEHRSFTRKTPVEYGGVIELRDLEPKTAVVCFSRKSVYIVARELQKLGKKVGVLYGALPLKVRKTQIQSYLDGEYDIMVTTDVIGHGINLPIDNVVFAQTEKFDGTEVRDLRIWEAAQIAGRAGRFGLSEKGTVYLAAGLPWFSDDNKLVKKGVGAAGGRIKTDLFIEKALVAPTLSDLGIVADTDTREAMILLLPALRKWQAKAKTILKDRVLLPADLTPHIENASAILRYLNCESDGLGAPNRLEFSSHKYNSIRPIPVDKLWQLISGPFDAKLGLLTQVAEWIVRQQEGIGEGYLQYVFEARVRKSLDALLKMKDKELYRYVEQLEEFTRVIGELKMVFVMFGEDQPNGDVLLGTLKLSDVLKADEEASNLITQALTYSIRRSSYGTCKVCGSQTLPWFTKCDDCFSEGKNEKSR